MVSYQKSGQCDLYSCYSFQVIIACQKTQDTLTGPEWLLLATELIIIRDDPTEMDTQEWNLVKEKKIDDM